MNLLYMIEKAIEKEFDIFKKENPIVSKRDFRPFRFGFIKGIVFTTVKLYNEKELKEMCDKYHNQMCLLGNVKAQEWFEQNKKK